VRKLTYLLASFFYELNRGLVREIMQALLKHRSKFANLIGSLDDHYFG